MPRQVPLSPTACGPRGSGTLPREFQTADWHEVRLDISPEVRPDIVGNIVDMPMIEQMSVDGVWSSHNLEHIFAHARNSQPRRAAAQARYAFGSIG